jgi:osmoprotectant transport system permease protein
VARQWLDARVGEAPPLAAVGEGNAEGNAPASVWTLAIQRRGEIAEKTLQHLVLTVLGVLIAIVLGVPLGIFIHRNVAARGPVLAMTEIVQTIPSLAMLAFLFAVYGLLGAVPAVTALVLYALLPIVLNTFIGLREVPRQTIQAADGVGMSSVQRLRMVELPLAAPVLIGGIRAATVLTVGIATLCTYIGAGGLGDFIARGLARNDPRLTLLGAVPAAIMAVVLSLLIRLMEKVSRRA